MNTTDLIMDLTRRADEWQARYEDADSDRYALRAEVRRLERKVRKLESA